MKHLTHTKFFAALAVLVFFAVSDGVAQKTERKKKEKKEKKDKSQAEVDNAYSPFRENATFDSDYATSKSQKQSRQARKMSKKEKKDSYTYNYLKNLDIKKKEFYKRMKQNAKEDRKMAREMKKPQYSDPMYFGHKKKPKKRPVGKRKFCKECGIIH